MGNAFRLREGQVGGQVRQGSGKQACYARLLALTHTPPSQTLVYSLSRVRNQVASKHVRPYSRTDMLTPPCRDARLKYRSWHPSCLMFMLLVKKLNVFNHQRYCLHPNYQMRLQVLRQTRHLHPFHQRIRSLHSHD